MYAFRPALLNAGHLTSSVREHSLDQRLIGIRCHHVDVQIALSLCGLLGQDVAGVRVPALDLSGGGQAESLGRSFMSLEFWHYSSTNYESLLLRREHDEHVHAFEFVANFDGAVFGKILLEPLKQRDAEFLVSNLA